MQESDKAPVITVDGPSGSGKGTLAQLLAQHLGWHYLDSGALYRVLALAANHQGITLSNQEDLGSLVQNLDVQFASDSARALIRVFLDGVDVSDIIRSEDCGNIASKIAVLPKIREILLVWQRDFHKAPGLVTDGRDMGTVVFPEAVLKIFLTANSQERAKRRYKQLKKKV